MSLSGDDFWRALLGRELLASRSFTEDFADQRILITGAGGSLGRGLVTEFFRAGVAEVRAVDQSEAALVRLDEFELPRERLQPILEDVRDQEALTRAADGVDLVVHAAAFKHVPVAETASRRVILNNVGAVLAMYRAAKAAGVPRFALLSTDKVVHAQAVMGLTKRCAEGLIKYDAKTETKAVTARLANVLGSAGSVMPIFIRRLAAKRSLPLTGPESSRFFLAPREALEGILLTAAHAKDGEVYAPDPGEAIAIEDFGRRLHRALGHDGEPTFKKEAPRPGDQGEEALFEESENAELDAKNGTWIAPRCAAPRLSEDDVATTLAAIENGDDNFARSALKDLLGA